MKILGIISIVAIVISLICGLWMKWGSGQKDANFHGMLSLGTLLLCLATIILYMLKK